MNLLKILRLFLMLPLFMHSFAYSSENKIAYLANTGDYWQVWTMNSDGSEKQKITTSGYDKSRISWFPGGVEILVNGSQGQLSRVNIQTLEENTIVLPIKGTIDAVVSPSGKRIAFSLSVADSIDNNHIWTVDDKGDQLSKITSMEGTQHEPVWSIDEKWIYFLSGKGGQSHNIWRTSLENKTTEKITIDQLYNFDITFSQSGDMAFSSNRSGNYDIWLQKENTFEQITNHSSIESRPTISPDGKSIAFESLRTGRMNIWQKSLSTSELTQLTNEPIGARYPVWFH